MRAVSRDILVLRARWNIGLVAAAAIAACLVFGGCRPPPSEWPAFEPVEVARSRPGSRAVVLPSGYEAFMRGQIAYNDGEPSKAVRHFRAALRTDPESSYVLAWVARAELAAGRVERARTAIDSALEYDGCSELALCVAASILLEEGEPEGAMRSLQRAIVCEPRQPEAYFELAELLEEQSAPARAEAILRRLLQVLAPAAQPRARRELARLALARGDDSEATRQLSLLLVQEPWRWETVTELAALNFARGDTLSARVLLDTVVARNPRAEESRRLLARVLLAAGNTADAVRHLDALRPEPDDVVRLAELAELYLAARRYDRAAEDARRVLALDGSHPVARRVLLAALRHLGRGDEVVAQLAEVPASSAAADGAYREAGLALWEAGRSDAARQLLERVVVDDSNTPRSRELLAHLLTQSEGVAAAEALLRRGTTPEDRLTLAARLLAWDRPGEVEALLAPLANDDEPGRLARAAALRAWALLAGDGDGELLSQLAEQARRLAPLDAEVLALEGAVASVHGRHDAAVLALQRASRRRPGSASILGELARALERAGRCEESVSVARRALRFRPAEHRRARLEQLIEALSADGATCGDDSPESALSEGAGTETSRILPPALVSGLGRS